MISKTFNFVWLDRGKEWGMLEFMSIFTKMKLYGDMFKYILWTDNVDLNLYKKSILLKNGLQIRDLHEVVPPITKDDPEWEYYGCDDGIPFLSDYYRFNLMYKYGGIYSDLDSIAINRIPYQYFNYKWVAGIENVPGTKNPYGVFIGFFMCEPDNPYLYKYSYLRMRLKAHYAPNTQLGILCTDTEGSLFLPYEVFCPCEFTDNSLGEFLRGDYEFKYYKGHPNICEFHCFNDALGRIPHGMEMLESKLNNYYSSLI